MEKHHFIRKRYVNTKSEKETSHVVKRPYVKCFGKFIPVSEEEVKNCSGLIVWR